jgi:hypothetical protein
LEPEISVRCLKQTFQNSLLLENALLPVPIEILYKIPQYFCDPHFEFHLDPSYEPDLKPPDEEHEKYLLIYKNIEQQGF